MCRQDVAYNQIADSGKDKKERDGNLSAVIPLFSLDLLYGQLLAADRVGNGEACTPFGATTGKHLTTVGS